MWQRPIKHLPYDDILNILNYVAVVRPRSEVRFTGGEPCLHPNILEILKETKRRKLSVSLISNGTVLERPDIIEIGFDRLFLSVDSQFQDIQKEIRGKCVDKKLLQSFSNIIANVILSKINQGEVNEIPYWLKKKGINIINLIPMKTDPFKLPQDRLTEILCEVLKVCFDLNINHFVEGLENNGIDARSVINVMRNITSSIRCIVPKYVQFYRVDGERYYCNSSPHNISSDKLLDHKNIYCKQCRIYRAGKCDYSNIILNGLSSMRYV